jgi:hypothetical protein
VWLGKGFWIGTCVGGACPVISSEMVSECRPSALTCTIKNDTSALDGIIL